MFGFFRKEKIEPVKKISINPVIADAKYNVEFDGSAIGQIYKRNSGSYVYAPYYNSWGAGIDLTAAGMRRILSKLDELNGVDSEDN